MKPTKKIAIDPRFLRRSRWPSRAAHPTAFADFKAALRDLVLPGFIPPAPVLDWTSPILCMGSCFADEIYKSLIERGAPAIHAALGEELNSPFANWTYVDYALRGTPYRCLEHEETWPSEALQHMRDAISRAKAVVMTLGVGFCAFRDNYLTIDLNPRRLQGVTWRLTSPEENAFYIEDTIQAFREVNPDILVILTVSPIPLKNSFLHDSPVVADCLSKSSLRMAADMVFSRNLTGLFYWPSFEAIRWVAPHHGQVYGLDDDQRHVGRFYINAITESFIELYLPPRTEPGAPA